MIRTIILGGAGQVASGVGIVGRRTGTAVLERVEVESTAVTDRTCPLVAAGTGTVTVPTSHLRGMVRAILPAGAGSWTYRVVNVIRCTGVAVGLGVVHSA